jgi:hypothetical protein
MFLTAINWFNKNSGKKLTKNQMRFLDILHGIDYYVLFPILVVIRLLWKDKVFVLCCIILYFLVKHFL